MRSKLKNLLKYFFLVSSILILTIVSAFIGISYDKSSRLILSFALEQAGYNLDLGSINIERSLTENSYYLGDLRINELKGETSFQANRIKAHLNFLDLLRLDTFLKIKLEGNSIQINKLQFDTKKNFFTDFLLDRTSFSVVDLEIRGSLNEVNISEYFYLFYGSSKDQIKPLITIKDLKVNNARLGPLSFPNISFSLRNTKEGLSINTKSPDLSGSIIIKSPLHKGLDIDLSYLKIPENNMGSSNELFSYLLANLRIPLYFYVDNLTLGSRNLGNWDFVIRNTKDKVIFDKVKGKSELLRFEINDLESSSLSISKRGSKVISSLKTDLTTNNLSKSLENLNVSKGDDNFKAGKTNLKAELIWEGFPEDIEVNNIRGEISFNLKNIIIKEIDTENSVSDLLKLISLFNVSNTLGDITNLQFREKFKAGFYADSLRGAIIIDSEGILIDTPIVFEGSSGQYSWSGNLKRAPDGNIRDLSCELIMTLPLKDYLPAYALLLGGPLTAGMVYIAGKAFKKPLNKLSSGKWRIKGTLNNPKTEFIEWFE